MDKIIIEMVKNLTEKFEKFLQAFKNEGDTTIDDVLKRMEDLKKET